MTRMVRIANKMEYTRSLLSCRYPVLNSECLLEFMLCAYLDVFIPLLVLVLFFTSTLNDIIIVIMWMGKQSVRDVHHGDRGFHGELDCCDGAYFDDKRMLDSSCCCHDGGRTDLIFGENNKRNHLVI